MAGPYVNVANAFRQPTLQDTYISLIVQALLAFGNPYSTPRETAVIANYIQTTFPLFPLSVPYLEMQLGVAAARGVVSRCGFALPVYWLLREDLTVVNPDNWKYIEGRCSFGGPLMRTCEAIGDNCARGFPGKLEGCIAGTAASLKDCAVPCADGLSDCGVPAEGCCPPIPNTG